MERTEQLKMAFVGCGLIARAHWKGVREYAPLIKVTAVIDTDRERAEEMAAKTGGRAFYSLEEALAGGDFDAVDIMLPHNQHEATAVRALGAGKHVLLEKPMATTLKRRQLRLGDSPKPWRYDKEVAGGGIVIDGGSHWIRPLRMWLGEIDEVVATLGYPLAEMDGESLARALCRFKSGAVAVFDALRAGFEVRPREEFRITGTVGEIVIERGTERRVLFFDRDTPQGREVMAKGNGREAAFGLGLDDFSHAVLEGRPLAASPEYSLGELRTALAMYRSMESRRWEKVWE